MVALSPNLAVLPRSQETPYNNSYSRSLSPSHFNESFFPVPVRLSFVKREESSAFTRTSGAIVLVAIVILALLYWSSSRHTKRAEQSPRYNRRARESPFHRNGRLLRTPFMGQFLSPFHSQVTNIRSATWSSLWNGPRARRDVSYSHRSRVSQVERIESIQEPLPVYDPIKPPVYSE